MTKVNKLTKIAAFVSFVLLTLVTFLRLNYGTLIFGLLLILNLVLFFSLLNLSKKGFILLMLIYLSFASVLTIKHYDKHLFDIGGLEKHQLIKRESYHRREAVILYRTRLGKIYLNSKKVYIDKVVKKMAAVMQPNLYFSSREETSYPQILIPVFLIGMLFLLYKYRNLVLTYIFASLVVSVFVETGKAELLFLPLINLAIVVSVFLILRRLGIMK